MTVADLTVTASNDGPWAAGGIGSYTLVVSASPTHGSSEKLVNLTHRLPSGVTAESAAGEGWSCSISGHTVNCLSTRAVAPGEMFPPVVVKVSVSRHLSGTVTARTGLSVAGAEADTTNNTATSDAEVLPN
ncbi:hypothetical protein [Actinokineospora sp. HUAS TT18]|uniref:hypothetical protein n=1 Tax=Actinokineospora sp. HUAS TT18 TaxID=3447451 RepID=UPI003F528AD1